jgi:hypothetical protein
MMTGLALSPDGTKLAIAIRLGPDVQAIMLYPVGGGAARIWSGHGTIGTSVHAGAHPAEPGGT